MTKTPKDKPQPGLFDEPVAKPKFTLSRYDKPIPVGCWIIQVPDRYMRELKMDGIDRYILEEHRASPGGILGLRWYHYTPETLRILKCQGWEDYQDERDGLV